jgi:DNA-binding transcriptional ArsR family regulator
MDLSEPSSAITPSMEGPVLRVLANTRLALSARAVSRLAARGSQAGVNRTLRRLADQGLVLTAEAGSATLYSLNRRHIAAPIVELLADLRNELIRRLTDEIGAWPRPPVFASLFGSAARADGDTGSDIDLFFIRPAALEFDDRIWMFHTQRLAVDVRDWTGNHASIIEVGSDELTGKGRAHVRRIVDSIRADWIVLHGEAPPELDESP